MNKMFHELTIDKVIEDMKIFREYLEHYDDSSSISSPRVLQVARMKQWIGMLETIYDRDKFQVKLDKSCNVEIFLDDTKCVEIKLKNNEE